MPNKTKMHDRYGDFKVLGENSDNTPLVSVVMSAYDTPKKFLSKSIESVLDQSYENFEFIIINDGADRLTSEILNTYAKKDVRIRLVIQDNMGLTKSLNRGVLLAKGKYIARQDTDDLWMTEKLKQQLDIVESKKNIVLVGTYCRVLDKDFNDITDSLSGFNDRLNIIGTEEIRKALTKFNPFCHASILVNAEVLKKLSSYNDSYTYSQDYELWVRIMHKHEAMIIPDALTKKIFHSESITGGSKRSKQRLLGLKARYKAMQYFNAPFSEKIKLWLKYFTVQMLPESVILIRNNFKNS